MKTNIRSAYLTCREFVAGLSTGAAGTQGAAMGFSFIPFWGSLLLEVKTGWASGAANTMAHAQLARLHGCRMDVCPIFSRVSRALFFQIAAHSGYRERQGCAGGFMA